MKPGDLVTVADVRYETLLWSTDDSDVANEVVGRMDYKDRALVIATMGEHVLLMTGNVIGWTWGDRLRRDEDA